MVKKISSKDMEILSDEKIPEAIRVAIANSLLAADADSEGRELEARKLQLEAKKTFWSTPLVAALAGLITLTATFVFDRLTTRDQITIEQLKTEIENGSKEFIQKLEDQTKKVEADLAASAEERKFQYEIVKAEFSDPKKSNIQRAAVLLFLVRAGVLTKLNAAELKLMAEEQKNDPKADITPPLASDQGAQDGVRNRVSTLLAAPWQVALLDPSLGEIPYVSQYCGGAFITEQWVLTSAQCASRYGEVRKPEEISVAAGSLRLDTVGSISAVESIVRHPQFNATTLDFDIALLKLKAPVMSGYQASLVLGPEPPDLGHVIRVTGWGQQSDGASFGLDMTYADYGVRPSSACKSQRGELTSNMICAGALGVDACEGFTGGLATLLGGTLEAAGILSWREGCGSSHKFAVFTRVSPFLNWISETTSTN